MKKSSTVPYPLEPPPLHKASVISAALETPLYSGESARREIVPLKAFYSKSSVFQWACPCLGNHIVGLFTYVSIAIAKDSFAR